MDKNTIIRELHTLKSNILELPQRYPTSIFTFGAGIAQAKEQVPIICSNIDDAINALKKGKDSYNRPITKYQIADGLSNLIKATQRPQFIGLITSVFNNDGINELEKKMNELGQIAAKIRSFQPESISHQQPIPQPQDIAQPQAIPRPQAIPQPVYRQEKEIENLIQVDSKDFKVKFKDYTFNEKAFRVITESIAVTLIIYFPIFIIWSAINQLYENIVISIIIMAIYFIPHEILEKKLRNNARIRKQKAMIAKYVDLKKVQSPPSYQSQPVSQPEPIYQPAPRQEPEKIMCHSCGSENLKTNKYCENCGSVLD